MNPGSGRPITVTPSPLRGKERSRNGGEHLYKTTGLARSFEIQIRDVFVNVTFF